LNLKKKQREIDFLNINKKQQSIINYSLEFGFVLIFLFVFFIFKSLRKQRKSNEIIGKQKNIIEDALRAKNKFFNLISHDLKNPIYNFHSLTELMSQNYDMLSDEDKFRHLNSLTNSSKSVVNLLDNLLTWSRIQNGTITTNPEILDIKELVIGEIENIKHIAEAKKIGLINEISSLTLIYCDKDMVMAILRNLISNAIKFSNENGFITISSIEKDIYVNVSIKDTGVGIKDEDKTKIFNLDSDLSKLGTADEKGTGLGLNLCKDFVELNFGNIWFESQVGFGTTFTFSLPLSELE
jgi:two-component system sensor histidine kinase/response regulator